MSKQKILLIVGILILAGAILVLPNSNAKSKTPFIPKPLIGATEEEINKAAIEYTYSRFEILSGVPTVLLNMPVTKDDLPALGLSSIDFVAEDPPLTLVVLTGDFDVSNMRGNHSNSSLKAQFIVYVFDLYAGAPTLISCSATGARFSKLLSGLNMDLPEEPPTNVDPNEPVPEPQSEPQPEIKPPYGSVAPGVEPPIDIPGFEPTEAYP